MRRLRWGFNLNTGGAGFVQGMMDAAETTFAPDRYKHPLAQLEYEAGWAFARWCFRTGAAPRDSGEIGRMFWGQAVFDI